MYPWRVPLVRREGASSTLIYGVFWWYRVERDRVTAHPTDITLALRFLVRALTRKARR